MVVSVVFAVMIVSDTITSHCQISCWDAWLITCIWIESEFLILKANIQRAIPSIMIEIQMQAHANLVASQVLQAVMIDNITNKAQTIISTNRYFWTAFCCIQLKIKIHHLINAQRAKHQIVRVQIKFHALQQSNKIQKIVIRIHIANKNHMYCTHLFLIALIIADTQDNNKSIHSTIFINVRKRLQLHTITNQKIMVRIANQNINRKYNFLLSIMKNIRYKYIFSVEFWYLNSS